MNKRTGLSLLCCLAGLCGRADVVHIFEQTECVGETAPISERSLVAGMPWSTQAAPVKSGYIFTHWTISTTQDFAARDEWGRAFDAATFMLYEDTTLTAHYLPVSQDEDILLVSSQGIVIRLHVDDIRQCRRPSKGVRVMHLTDDAKVLSLVRTARADDAEEEVSKPDAPDADAEDAEVPTEE